MSIIQESSFDIEKYKRVLFDTMKSFMRICEQKNLQYFGSGGTVLGAVRHHGIIPWDDDIDVYMPRKDYNEFIKLKGVINESGYEICTIDDDGYYLPYAKFCNTNTTIWERAEFPFIIGVFIDVFPLDECNGKIDEMKSLRNTYGKFVTKYLFSIRNTSLKEITTLCKEKHYRKAFSFLRKYLINKCIFGPDKYKKKIFEYEKYFQSLKGDYLLYFFCTYKVEKEIYKKEWFDDYVLLPFEDFQIRVCKGYKEYLTQLFGDYMTPPKVEMRVSRHFHYYVNLEHRLSLEEVQAIKKQNNNK